MGSPVCRSCRAHLPTARAASGGGLVEADEADDTIDFAIEASLRQRGEVAGESARTHRCELRERVVEEAVAPFVALGIRLDSVFAIFAKGG
jgi:hypothetical protein